METYALEWSQHRHRQILLSQTRQTAKRINQLLKFNTLRGPYSFD